MLLTRRGNTALTQNATTRLRKLNLAHKLGNDALLTVPLLRVDDFALPAAIRARDFVPTDRGES